MKSTILTIKKGSDIKTETIAIFKEHNGNLGKKIENLVKDIPHWRYLTADIDKKSTDAVIKKNALLHLPVEYTEDMIEDFLIDRKQGKMVILMK